jgi:hypothetical protein
MLVTFKTDAHADIIMFGDVAQTLLKLMGQSGRIPGALLAADIPQALARLQGGGRGTSGPGTGPGAPLSPGGR